MEEKAPEKSVSKFRQYQGPAAILVKALGAGGGLFCVLYVAGVFSYVRIFLLSTAYNAIFLAIVLTLIFLLIPATKGAPRNKLPWYDILLILGSLSGTLYIAVNAIDLLFYGRISATPLEITLGVVTFLALVEAVRRSFGWPMVIIVNLFIFYTKFGSLIPGKLKVYPFDWSHLVADIYLSSGGIFGHLTGIASGIILVFVTFGAFILAIGAGEFFLKLALAVTGVMRGGAAKASIVASMLFGTVSGSGVANVVVTGTTTIPMMKSTGYKGYYAGAIEAIASTGGAIVPPVMAGTAFVMSMMIGKPYSYIATIAILPAFLYYLALFIQVDLHAAKTGIHGIPRAQLPPLGSTLKGGWELIIPIVVLIVFLFGFRYTAETSAIYTIVSVIIVSMFRKSRRMNIKMFINALNKGFLTTMEVAGIIALAGSLLAVLSITGLGPKLSGALLTLFGGSFLLLIIAAALTCYFLGMGIAFTAAYILVAALVAPALTKLGLPVAAAHFFILYMVISGNFTPPLCPAAYVAGSIADAKPFKVGFQAMRLGIVVFLIPLVITYNPALLLMGTAAQIAQAAVTAAIGIIALSAGFEGYLFKLKGMNWLQRILFIGGGLLMFVPGTLTDIVGLGVIALAVFWQWTARREEPRPSDYMR